MENVEIIKIRNEDGTEESFARGVLATFDKDGEEEFVTARMVGMHGDDLVNIVKAFVLLAYKIGIFDEEEENESNQKEPR